MALSAMQRSVSRVLQCSRWQKRGIMMIADALILPLLLWGAYALRFSTLQPVVHDTWLFPIAALTSVAMLYVCGFYRSILRYLGSEAAWSIVTGMAASVITLAAMSYMVPAEVPRSIFVIYWLLGTMYLGASRFLARRFLFRVMAGYLNRERVAVFGAGEAGAQLVAALQSGRELNPVLVVDDDPGKQGSLLCGVPVVNRQGLQAKAKQGAISTEIGRAHV